MKCDSCRPGNGLLKTCSEYQRDKREREGRQITNKGTVPTEFYYACFVSTGYFVVSHQQTEYLSSFFFFTNVVESQ